MDIKDIASVIFQYGGTVIMAVLFIWVFIQDKIKNNKMLEDNTQILKVLNESNSNNTQMLRVLTESNNNIAKSLDIISNNLVTIDNKIDRNYEIELKKN